MSAACRPEACTVTGHRTPSSAAGSGRHLLRVIRAAGRPPCQLHHLLAPEELESEERTVCQWAQGKPGGLTAGSHATRRSALLLLLLVLH